MRTRSSNLPPNWISVSIRKRPGSSVACGPFCVRLICCHAVASFLASIQNQPPSLFPMPPMLEFEQEENPFRDHLAVEPIIQSKGIVAVPNGPGLGIEIDRKVIDRYRVS